MERGKLMSGGHFDYKQYSVSDLASEVLELITENEYPPQIIAEFQKGYDHLRLAGIYAQRIDWLVSGDDGEAAFLQRLEEDLIAEDYNQ
jgi:hypothetical protein